MTLCLPTPTDIHVLGNSCGRNRIHTATYSYHETITPQNIVGNISSDSNRAGNSHEKIVIGHGEKGTVEQVVLVYSTMRADLLNQDISQKGQAGEIHTVKFTARSSPSHNPSHHPRHTTNEINA